MVELPPQFNVKGIKTVLIDGIESSTRVLGFGRVDSIFYMGSLLCPHFVNDLINY